MAVRKTFFFSKHIPIVCAFMVAGCGIGKQKDKIENDDEVVSPPQQQTCNPDSSGALRFTGTRVERCKSDGWIDIRNTPAPTREMTPCEVFFNGSLLPCSQIASSLNLLKTENCSVRETEHGAEVSCGTTTVLIPNGERGAKGRAGVKGSRGFRGEKGNRGSKGESGRKGPMNPKIGPQGPIGDKGETGEKGDTGDSGTEKGERGPLGDSGAVGEKGDTGPQGPQGPSNSITGPQGPQGMPGAQGPQGNPGKKISPSGGGRGGWCKATNPWEVTPNRYEEVK